MNQTHTANVISVRAKNNLVLSQQGRPLHPHREIWTAVAGYTQPAAFSSTNASPAILEVRLQVQPDALPFTLQAVAADGTVLFEGVQQSPDRVQHIHLAFVADSAPATCLLLHWQLLREGEEALCLNDTPVELYWIEVSDNANSLHRRGIAVEALRFRRTEGNAITTGEEGSGVADVADSALVYDPVVGAVVQDVFDYVPPRYDIWTGAPHFVTINSWNDITLHYNAYVHAHTNQPNSILNCYDTAAILQYKLSLIPRNTHYCYMQPFGYLRLTELIGRGQCNNPFYGATGGTAVINPSDAARTAFGNHAFVSIDDSGKVADACNGPAYGNQSPAEYVQAATDDVFPNPPRVQRGTTADITYYTGVTHVDLVSSVASVADFPHSEAFMNSIGSVSAQQEQFGQLRVVAPWRRATENALLEGYILGYEEIVPGTDEVLKFSILTKEDSYISVKMYVCSTNPAYAYNRFVSLGSLSQSQTLMLEQGPQSLGANSAVVHNAGYSRCIWQLQNVVADILSTDPTIDAVSIAEWYYQYAVLHLQDSVEAHLPHTQLNYSGPDTNTDSSLFITAVTDANILLDYVHTENSPRLISADDKHLIFDSLNPTQTELNILVVDKDTLLVHQQRLPLQVRE